MGAGPISRDKEGKTYQITHFPNAMFTAIIHHSVYISKKQIKSLVIVRNQILRSNTKVSEISAIKIYTFPTDNGSRWCLSCSSQN